jgi:hypothetical protein
MIFLQQQKLLAGILLRKLQNNLDYFNNVKGQKIVFQYQNLEDTLFPKKRKGSQVMKDCNKTICQPLEDSTRGNIII